MKLNIKEIIDLAELVGLEVINTSSKVNRDISVIIDQKKDGFAAKKGDFYRIYRSVAECNGEVFPLGDHIYPIEFSRIEKN